MSQKIEKSVLEEFAKAQEKELREVKTKITNSGKPKTTWMKKITERIRISDIAAEQGVNKCPRCNYDLYFDDGRGWFCCTTKRFGGDCDFHGNIVDFVEKVGGLE